MEPSRQVVKTVSQHEKWHDDMANDQDGQVGRQIVGADMAVVLTTVRASLHRLQIDAEQWRAIAVWAAFAIPSPDRIPFRDLIAIRRHGHPSRALESQIFKYKPKTINTEPTINHISGSSP